MLINALCNYYDVLAQKGKVLHDGYSNVNINYMICLNPDGKIDEIIDCQKSELVPSGKDKLKEIKTPIKVIMPKRTEKPGIDGNIIEHRPLYIFGLNYDKLTSEFTADDKTNKAKKSHAAFVEKNLEFIGDIESPVVNAYRNFINNWIPENETQNSFLTSIAKNYANSSYIFCLSGYPDLALHKDGQIISKWEEQFSRIKSQPEGYSSQQCAISGKTEPIARIHGKIKGIYGGLATGTVLIGFNNTSEESYGNSQSYNSNISVSAMKKYTEALNYLLYGKSHKSSIDNITVIFWAADDNERCNDFTSALLFENSEKMDTEETEKMLSDLVKSAREGSINPQRIASTEKIDVNTDFYIVGIKPNSSRLALKFIYRKRFGELLYNIAMHQNDLQISETFASVPIWEIRHELISPKSKNETVDPSLLTKIFQSVIYGTEYPPFLLACIMRRVKTDKNINSVRAGIIKACLNRTSRTHNKKEEIKLALDKENTNPAYLSGRLFAVLEMLQQNAANNKLNRTIKDSYFAAAASKPSMVFPKLLKLAQNHLNKSKSSTYYNILIGEIIGKLNNQFPDTLLLKDQGIFMIGYYQQYQNFYTGKKESIENKEEN